MFAVETYAVARWFVFFEGTSWRERARTFGLSQDTIPKMCCYLAPPWYVQSRAPERPTLGPRFPVIDTILKADKRAIPKERHIAKQIVEGLWTYMAVKGYVWIARPRARQILALFARPPGHAQVYLGECVGVIRGVRMKLHVLCFDMPQPEALL
jgi:hypothetical protein